MNRKSDEILNALKEFLAEKKAEDLLPEITDSLEKGLAYEKEKDQIIVKSAVKISEKQLNEIKNLVKRILKVDYPIKNPVDPSLIAGFNVKVNDWFFEASLLNDLENFKTLLLD